MFEWTEQSWAAEQKQCHLYSERITALWMDGRMDRQEAIAPHRLERPVSAVHDAGQRLASFNPDKLIGSRRGEGDPLPPLTPLSKERWGWWAARLKDAAADAITVIAINQNYLAVGCTGSGVKVRWILTTSLRRNITKTRGGQLVACGPHVAIICCSLWVNSNLQWIGPWNIYT